MLSVTAKAEKADRTHYDWTYTSIDDMDWYVSHGYENYYPVMFDFFTKDDAPIEIGGKTYRKLYGTCAQFDGRGKSPLRTTADETMYQFGIREETGRLLASHDEYMALLASDKPKLTPVGDPGYTPYEVTADGEIVLYDFNMQAGDKFRSADGHDDISVVKTGVMADDNGTERRLLTLSNGIEAAEGLGCLGSQGAFIGWLNPEKEDNKRFTALTHVAAGAETVYSRDVKDLVKSTLKSMLNGYTRWDFYSASLDKDGKITGKTVYAMFADNSVTARDGKVYRNIYLTGNGETRLILSAREDGGRVYAGKEEYSGITDLIHKYPAVLTEYVPDVETGGDEIVLYDFNMRPGDRLRSVTGHETVTVASVSDTVTADGNTRRQLLLSNGMRIIEGIGGIGLRTGSGTDAGAGTPFVTFSGFVKFNTGIYAKTDDEVISGIITGIGATRGEASTTGRRGIYNIKGQRLGEEPQQGLYIKDGKKIIRQPQ